MEFGYGEPPAPPASTEPDWHITHLAFKKRFPRAKWDAARELAKTNKDFYSFFEDFDLATYVDLHRTDTVMSVQSLANASVPADVRLTLAEIDAVLLNAPTSVEIYRG